MLGWLHQKLSTLYAQPTPALALAVFRVVYGLILMGEVGQLIYFQHLIFDPVPYLQLAEINYLPLLLLWLLVLACLVLGLFTRLAVIFNYAFSLATLALFKDFGYHIDYAYISVNFLLMLAPVSGVFSLDAHLKITNRQEQVSGIWAYLIFFFGVGFTYLDSALYKLVDPVWQQGWGVWFASSLLPNTYQDLSFFLNNQVFMQVLGYLVLVFEIIFPVLVFFRRFRLRGILFGLAFHAGTLLVYPIPGFALSAMSFYLPLLFLPRWFSKNKYYSAENSPTPNTNPVRLRRDLAHFNFIPDAILLKLSSAFILYCVFGQLLCSLQSDLVKNLEGRKSNFKVSTWAAKLFGPVYYVNQKYLGIVAHEIFLARYFQEYEHIISLQYQAPDGTEKWLPITNQNGMNSYYNTGRIFCNWNYWVNSAHINQEKLVAGIRDYTAFWAVKNNISLQHATFTIRLKKTQVPLTWEKDFLKKQMQQPWQQIGTVSWQAGECAIIIPVVENL